MSKKSNVEEHADPVKWEPGEFSRERVNQEDEADPSPAGRYERAVKRAQREREEYDAPSNPDGPMKMPGKSR